MSVETELQRHAHLDNLGIKCHTHGGRTHHHVDDGPSGVTLRDAGWSEDMPKFPERFPCLAEEVDR